MDKAEKLTRYNRPDEHGGRTCRHPRYGGSDRCAEMVCWNYYMKGGGFWDDELPGMWESADFTGGETDTVPETYHGVKIPDDLRPNWDDNRVEVSWWKSGVRSALGRENWS